MEYVVTPGLDPAHDVLHYGRQALDSIFAPKSVAVIGATETVGSVGRTIVWNLISSSFGGTIYPVILKALKHSRHQGLSHPFRCSRSCGFDRCGHTGSLHSGHHQGLGRSGHQKRHHYFCGL